jgi:hypothetical protein
MTDGPDELTIQNLGVPTVLPTAEPARQAA